MSWWTVLQITLIALLIFLSVKSYIQTSLPARLKALFIALRISAVLLIFIAFIEPSFHFQKFIPRHNDIPVLIDASRSMTLFRPESSVVKFMETLEYANDHSEKKSRKYRFFLFGDSLRHIKSSDELRFTDQTSDFPHHNDKIITNAQDMIIISDANWSNSVPVEHFSDKSIRYLKLSSFTPLPFININRSNFSDSVPDSSSIITIGFEGRIDKPGPVNIKISENGKVIARQDLNENSTGYFKHDIKLKLPKPVPGKHLYRIEISHSDTISASTYCIKHTLPESFAYSLMSSSSTLDRRFISLGLSRHSEFKKKDLSKNASIDCIFFFNWDDSLKHYLKHLKSTGVAIFAGCLPWSDIQSINPAKSKFVKSPTVFSEPLKKLNIEKLPPPSMVYKSRSHTVHNPYFYLVNNNDTLPVLYRSKWNNISTLTLAAKDFWKWDFLPMSVDYSEDGAFSFSEILISILKDHLLSLLSEQFFIYPASQTNTCDSLELYLSFPSAVAVAENSQLSVMIKNDGGSTVLDTSINVLNTGSQHQKVVLGPLRAGKYKLTSSLHKNEKKYIYTDSIEVKTALDELQISGQNTLLLSDIGLPINTQDSLALTSHLKIDNTSNGFFKEDNFQIRRNWLLLIAILMILGTEWFLRRIKVLD